jgi:quinol monooxygenase YgiN
MELFIFARFHARQGQQEAVAAALREVVGPTGAEAGCRAIGAYRSTLDARLFYIHSRWRDAAAFERHATMPHTIRFIETAEKLVDQPIEVTRSHPLE